MDDFDARLEHECRVFCRYLAGLDAAPAVVRDYRAAHQVPRLNLEVSTPGDRALLTLATQTPSLARVADAFAGLASRRGVLRKKLVILLAILESHGTSAAIIDRATPGSRLTWAIAAAAQAGAWLMRVALASVLLIPMRLWYMVSTGR